MSVYVQSMFLLKYYDGLVGGTLPVAARDPSHQKKPLWAQDKIAHNPLDSTSPLVKKGKQREVPKAKKPTPLKRVRSICQIVHMANLNYV